MRVHLLYVRLKLDFTVLDIYHEGLVFAALIAAEVLLFVEMNLVAQFDIISLHAYFEFFELAAQFFHWILLVFYVFF